MRRCQRRQRRLRRAAPPAPQRRGRAGHAGAADAGAAVASRRSVAGRTGARVPRDRDRGRAAARAGSTRRRRTPKPRQPKATKPAAKKAKSAESRKSTAEGDTVANQSIRVNVDTLEHLMTMVSELVLTRNQLLEISRRNEDTEFKVPLQRLSNVTAELQEGVMKTRMQPIGNAWQKLPRIVRDLVGRTRQADRTGDARRRHRARPPGARPDQGSADPHGAQLGRSRPGDAGRARRRRQARAGHHPAVRLSRRRPHHHLHRRQRPRAQHRADQGQGGLQRSRQRGRTREDDRSADPQVHLRAGLLHRRRRHQRVRPRRRHGRGAHQYRPDRRHHRRQVGGRRGLLASPSRSR